MPARSKSQQRLFGMLHAYNKGELNGSKSLMRKMKEMSRHISDEDVQHFAKTPHEGLPEKKAYVLKALEKLAQGSHTVARGDTLSGISKKYGRNLQEVIKANPGINADRISIGQKITIPQKPKPAPAKPVTRPAVSTVPQTGINPVAKELHTAFNNSNLEAAILANIRRETGSGFDYRRFSGNPRQKFDPKVSQKGGYGLFQFTGPTLTSYKGWLTKGKLQDSPASQIKYMKDVYGPSRSGWKTYTSPGSTYTKEQIADWWHKKVETPAHAIPGNKAYSQAAIDAATKLHDNFMSDNIVLRKGLWTAK